MNLEIREGTVSDDQLCGTIMSAALEREDIPRLFLKNNVLILPLRNNLRMVAYYDNKPAGFCDYVISKGHINYLFVEPKPPSPLAVLGKLSTSLSSTLMIGQTII